MEKNTTSKFRDLINLVKDKASLSKAALLSKPNTSTLYVALVLATTHEPSIPSKKKHINIFLSYGHSSRRTASSCIEALMNRLHTTRNSFVAFKSLIIMHYIINRGSFILQDQLSVYPSLGGRNYLNLSNFLDNSTSETWSLSFWVRWYARVLETVLFTSRKIGFFLYSSIEKGTERVSGLSNTELLRELDVFVSLIEEICRAPELLNIQTNRLIYEATSLVREDRTSAQKEMMIRVNEMKERIVTLNFADSIELICVLKRYENCKERIASLLSKENVVGDRLWHSIVELRQKIGESKEYCEGRSRETARRAGASESARFGNRVVRPNESIRYGSSRLTAVRLPRPIIESTNNLIELL